MRKLYILSLLLSSLLVSGRMWAVAGCDTVRIDTTFTLCQSELPYTYTGAKAYVINNDTTVMDTIAGGAVSGCDSIAKVQFAVVRAKQVKETGYICDGNAIEWRGQTIDSVGLYYDTVRYAATGCDSACYTLNAVAATATDTVVYDTLCLIDAQLFYTRLKITGTGTYVDTIPSVITKCDSIITYHIQILGEPVMPAFKGFDQGLLPVICGDTLRPAALMEQVVKAAKIHSDTLADFYEMWLEVKMSKTDVFTKVAKQTIVAASDSIELRLAGNNECNRDMIKYSDVVKREVDIPTADNLSKLDTMPASKRYNNWILAINYNKITAMSYNFKEENVFWFRVVGDVDPVLAIKDDELVGTGFYYTADKSLQGSYYAVIQDTLTACAPILRTVVLACSPEKQMSLTPSVARRGTKMTLSLIDAEQPTQIDIYNMDGMLVRSIAIKGVDSYQIPAAEANGMYLLRAKNGDRTATFKFVVTQ